MTVRVIDRQTFGQGGGVEINVGREQRQRWEPSLGVECRGELHGVIAPQGMFPRQGCGLGHQGGGHFDDEV
jgi:hypothetical protein